MIQTSRSAFGSPIARPYCSSIALVRRREPFMPDGGAPPPAPPGRGFARCGRTFGTSPADIIAAIGPCLGACCGEDGPGGGRAVPRRRTRGCGPLVYDRTNRPALLDLASWRTATSSPPPGCRRTTSTHQRCARRHTARRFIPIALAALEPAGCSGRSDRLELSLVEPATSCSRTSPRPPVRCI